MNQEGCDIGEGSCNSDDDCIGDLVCGSKNCRGDSFDVDDNCCEIKKWLLDSARWIFPIMRLNPVSV